LIIPGHKGETFCNVAEEAKALGIPIITLGYGALSERVQNNYNGFLCENITDFKIKILKLLQDDELYLKFKHNLIKDRGINKWSNTTNRLLELFKE
ncbi:glycosyltransferase, partial [Candidatus Pelagibacter sp.]|nr:glycosyltransferase [Candidatus Pelagibacter sp.]